MNPIRKRRRLRRLIPAAACVLAGCAAAPPAAFDLAATTGVSARQARRAQIAIAEPLALPLLDSSRIVVRTGRDEVAYLTGGRWADRLPALLRARLFASFQNAGLIRTAASPGEVADYELRTQIRRFEFEPRRGLVTVEIAAQIIGAAGRIEDGRIFLTTKQAADADPASVAAALNAATTETLGHIVRWTAPRI